jgi:hypothetical protein
MSSFALVRFVFYALFGLTVPQSLLTLGFGLPYSRQVRESGRERERGRERQRGRAIARRRKSVR